MTAVALISLAIGTFAGFMLARARRFRVFGALVIGLVAFVTYGIWAPASDLAGQGFALAIASYLLAPTMTAGLMGGYLMGWMLRRHAKVT